jgi:hypothetical protein
MNRLAMSAAASGLLRALLARAAVSRDRILLSAVRSVEWQSLIFVGERHEFSLRVPGPQSRQVAERLCRGLEDVEFTIPGQIVADIHVLGELVRSIDGSINLSIEALTIAE